MGSSSKKHKRDSKKHKRRSRSRSRSRSPRYERERDRVERSRSHSEDEAYEADRRRQHKKGRRERSDNRQNRSHGGHRNRSATEVVHTEVNQVDESDSSDCVEVPLDEDVAPPPPSISRRSPSPRVPSPPPPPQVQKRRRSPSPPPPPKTSSSGKKKAVSPIPDAGAGDVLSIADTNKLRAKLGLRPLDVPSGSKGHSDAPRKRHRSPASPPQPPPPPPPPTTSSSSRKRSMSPIPEAGAGDVLSIEATNKLRAKLGLRPLDVTPAKPSQDASKDDAAADDGKLKDDWGEFYHKPARNLAEKTQEEKIREKLKERREKRAIEEKLKRLKTLGDDEEVDDVRQWVTKTRDKDKLRREADERARLLDALDEEHVTGLEREDREPKRRVTERRGAYRDRDLEGLRVEHDVEAFTEGRQVILTLKDADVLDESAGDTLVNVNMVDDERHKRNVKNRKANPLHYGYDVYSQEDDEVDEFGLPKEREVLGKYREEIEGAPRTSSFVIGSNAEEEAREKRRLLEIKTKLDRKKLDSLAMAPAALVSDYYTETELASFKKPKKKVRKIRQKLRADDILASLPAAEESGGAPDHGSRHSKRHGASAQSDLRQTLRQRSAAAAVADVLLTDDTPALEEDLSSVKLESTVEDDEDLQAVLEKARRLRQKEALISKALPIDPERIKSEVKEEPEDGVGGLESDRVRDGTMLLNSTAEFCRTLGDIPTYGTAGNREEDPNEMMDFERDSDGHGGDSEAEDVAGSSRRHGTWNSVNTEQEQEEGLEGGVKVEEVAILDEEPDVASSVAGALKLAQSKGYLEREESNRPSNARFAHLQAQNYSIEDKSHAEENDKYSRRDRYAGPIMDFKEKDSFKPNVKLEYIDDNGHLLTPKEAFRYLSHKFHGKGPGKNKVEKRLKKSEQEGLMKKMSSTDTPLGTLNMLQAKQKETQSPYIVLSGTKQNTSIIKQKR
ncbi:U4/U6.U5 tri-snRNP-associated protein 1 [Anopheles bellator]|uniref:U4/U6.U5 tri-snRNP-associated protein 1 n=1 Tax=Anopheles bellator TaxID=139047 RepID=UPI002647752F|nr:U4/U6.U5 tri-snRNP-associated protein 1 [Anopheles bellator]